MIPSAGPKQEGERMEKRKEGGGRERESGEMKESKERNKEPGEREQFTQEVVLCKSQT